MSYRVIIDADPGIGDAVAIMTALLDPEIDLVGLTAVAGRVTVEESMRNLLSIIALLDPPKWPRLGFGSGEKPGLPVDSGPFAHDLDGPGGFGDFEAYDVETADKNDADKVIVELVNATPNEVTLVTLGPLTNIQRALGRDPELLTKVRGLICLGGSYSVGGDVTPAAEFNFFADPEAAHAVVCQPGPTTIVPLDVTGHVQLTFDQFDRLKVDPHRRRGRLLNSLLPYYFRAHHQKLGREAICVGELAALAAITSPRFFCRERARVAIETGGLLTRGMSVFDRRGVPHYETNVDVLTEVDAQGVIDQFARVVRID